MVDTPRVSIITPSFNQAAYLEETICSVLDQDYPNLEYIIVDGGSTDGSVDIIQKYASHLSWWVSKPDQGQAEAINKGFSRATGEVIAWLNSDDLYTSGTIRAAVAALRANPILGMVYGDVRSIDETGRTIHIMHYANWELDDLMQFRIIGQPGVFMRKSVLDRAGYLDLNYHYLLDHHLWLRIAQLAPIQHVNSIWAAARFHPTAKNVAQASAFGRDAYTIVSWMQTQPGLTTPFERHHRQITAGAHRFNARYLLDGGQARQALAFYWQSLITHPPTALVEAHRMLYALLSLLGLSSIKPVYLRLRRAIQRLG